MATIPQQADGQEGSIRQAADCPVAAVSGREEPTPRAHFDWAAPILAADSGLAVPTLVAPPDWAGPIPKAAPG